MEELMEILENLRPDVDFENEKKVILAYLTGKGITVK